MGPRPRNPEVRAMGVTEELDWFTVEGRTRGKKKEKVPGKTGQNERGRSFNSWMKLPGQGAKPVQYDNEPRLIGTLEGAVEAELLKIRGRATELRLPD